MRVAWALPRYPTVHPAGAEWTAHELLAELAARGHEADAIIVGRHAGEYAELAELDGVTVAPVGSHTFARPYDVVIGHLGHAEHARAIAGRSPLVWMAHAPYQYEWGRPAEPDAWLANSEHVRAAGPAGTRIMRPHVPRTRYELDGKPRGDMITLVGASAVKGVQTVRAIARAMPERRFLVVQNAYDRQLLMPGRRDLPNIRVLPVQADMRPVYEQTRILLMPSTESFGRVALEAGHAGIPTIAAPSEGAFETQVAWAHLEPRDVDGWRTVIRDLDDVEGYRLAQLQARELAADVEFRTAGDRNLTVAWLHELAAAHPAAV